jgi:hypothetical protein
VLAFFAFINVPYAYLFAKGIRVDTECIDVAEGGRNAPLAEQMHQSMYTLLIVDMKIPKHAWVRNVRLWMAFMTPIHAWELDRVSNEEDRQVVEDEVLVAIFREEPHCPSSHISHGIAGSFLASHGGDSL